MHNLRVGGVYLTYTAYNIGQRIAEWCNYRKSLHSYSLSPGQKYVRRLCHYVNY